MNYVTFFTMHADPHEPLLCSLGLGHGTNLRVKTTSVRVGSRRYRNDTERSQAQTGKSLFSMQRLNSLTTGLTTG